MKRDFTDIIGGGILIIVALVFFVQALGYGVGTVTNMRAGFFPLAVSVLAACIGIGLILEGYFSPSGEMSPVAWRPLLAISASIAAFALLIGFGFVPAVVAAVGLAALGDPRSRPFGILLLAACCCAGVWAIFTLGLGLNLPALDGWR